MRLFKFVVGSMQRPWQAADAFVWVDETAIHQAEARARHDLNALGWAVHEIKMATMPTPDEFKWLGHIERECYRLALSQGVCSYVGPRRRVTT